MSIQPREIRLARFAYAGALVARILLGYKLLSSKKKRLSEEAYRQRLQEHHLRSAQWIYQGVLRLQGLMIKIGQSLGSRPDVLPEEYVRVLSRLQDQVPPRPFQEMRPHIERELGAPLEDVFAEFDSEPVAAASLAQVYRARLKDGRRVAVKVVYPNIKRLVHTDLKILKALIWLETRFFAYPLEPVYRELVANIPHEVDMVHEGQNMEAIASLLSDRPDIVIPEVIWEHTRKRVLVMQYVDGVKITDLPGLKKAGIDVNELFPVLADVYFEQMLKHGHFHADPHPGNLFGLPGNRLAIVDFGLAKQFTPEFKEAFKAITRCVFTGDNKGFAEGMKAAGFKLKREGDDSFIALAEFFRAMSDPSTYDDRELLEAVNDAWLKTLKKNPMVDMPGEITLPMRVFGLLFGLGATVSRNGDDINLAQTVISQSALKYTEDSQPESATLAS